MAIQGVSACLQELQGFLDPDALVSDTQGRINAAAVERAGDLAAYLREKAARIPSGAHAEMRRLAYNCWLAFLELAKKGQGITLEQQRARCLLGRLAGQLISTTVDGAATPDGWATCAEVWLGAAEQWVSGAAVSHADAETCCSEAFTAIRNLIRNAKGENVVHDGCRLLCAALRLRVSNAISMQDFGLVSRAIEEAGATFGESPFRQPCAVGIVLAAESVGEVALEESRKDTDRSTKTALHVARAGFRLLLSSSDASVAAERERLGLRYVRSIANWACKESDFEGALHVLRALPGTVPSDLRAVCVKAHAALGRTAAMVAELRQLTHAPDASVDTCLWALGEAASAALRVKAGPDKEQLFRDLHETMNDIVRQFGGGLDVVVPVAAVLLSEGTSRGEDAALSMLGQDHLLQAAERRPGVADGALKLIWEHAVRTFEDKAYARAVPFLQAAFAYATGEQKGRAARLLAMCCMRGESRDLERAAQWLGQASMAVGGSDAFSASDTLSAFLGFKVALLRKDRAAAGEAVAAIAGADEEEEGAGGSESGDEGTDAQAVDEMLRICCQEAQDANAHDIAVDVLRLLQSRIAEGKATGVSEGTIMRHWVQAVLDKRAAASPEDRNAATTQLSTALTLAAKRAQAVGSAAFEHPADDEHAGDVLMWFANTAWTAARDSLALGHLKSVIVMSHLAATFYGLMAGADGVTPEAARAAQTCRRVVLIGAAVAAVRLLVEAPGDAGPRGIARDCIDQALATAESLRRTDADSCRDEFDFLVLLTDVQLCVIEGRTDRPAAVLAQLADHPAARAGQLLDLVAACRAAAAPGAVLAEVAAAALDVASRQLPIDAHSAAEAFVILHDEARGDLQRLRALMERLLVVLRACRLRAFPELHAHYLLASCFNAGCTAVRRNGDFATAQRMMDLALQIAKTCQATLGPGPWDDLMPRLSTDIAHLASKAAAPAKGPPVGPAKASEGVRARSAAAPSHGSSPLQHVRAVSRAATGDEENRPPSLEVVLASEPQRPGSGHSHRPPPPPPREGTQDASDPPQPLSPPEHLMPDSERSVHGSHAPGPSQRAPAARSEQPHAAKQPAAGSAAAAAAWMTVEVLQGNDNQKTKTDVNKPEGDTKRALQDIRHPAAVSATPPSTPASSQKAPGAPLGGNGGVSTGDVPVSPEGDGGGELARRSGADAPAPSEVVGLETRRAMSEMLVQFDDVLVPSPAKPQGLGVRGGQGAGRTLRARRQPQAAAGQEGGGADEAGGGGGKGKQKSPGLPDWIKGLASEGGAEPSGVQWPSTSTDSPRNALERRFDMEP